MIRVTSAVRERGGLAVAVVLPATVEPPGLLDSSGVTVAGLSELASNSSRLIPSVNSSSASS